MGVESSMKILSCGDEAMGMHDLGGEEVLSGIVAGVVGRLVKKYQFYEKCSFGYSLMVNEELLRRVIGLGQAASPPIELDTFYNELLGAVERRAKPEHRETLQFVVFEHSMEIDAERIWAGLLKKDKRYFLRMLTKLQGEARETYKRTGVLAALKEIVEELDDGRCSFASLELLLPSALSAERKRLVELFTKERVDRLYMVHKSIESKRMRLDSIR
jgi:hypothetical protein